MYNEAIKKALEVDMLAEAKLLIKKIQDKD